MRIRAMPRFSGSWATSSAERAGAVRGPVAKRRGKGPAPLGGGDRPYAGPLARTLGLIADSFVVTISYSVTLLLVTNLVGLFTRNQFTVVDDGGPLWGLVLLGWWFLYLAGSVALAGRTIGKGLVGLRVQAPDGARPSASRSARRPSVRLARLIWPPPVMSADFSSASTWSSINDLESYNNRPMSVDLPSSTLPQMLKRKSSM